MNEMAANVGKMGAVKNNMPFIPQCPLAQSAAAEMPGDGWSSKPALFHWQSMSPHAELHQQLQPGNGHWNLKLWHSFQLTRAQKPCKVCAELGPFGGSCSWGHMQTAPNLAELISCLPETRGNSGLLCQKTKMAKSCQGGGIA